MSGTIRRLSDADLRLRELERDAKLRKSPCNRKPAQPATAPEVFWGAVEAKTHLNFRVNVTWDAVTEDEHGFPVDDISTYEVEVMAVDAAGDPIERKNGNPLVRYQVITKPGKEGDDPDAWMVADMGKAFKPKKVAWKARYHAQANGCWGDWSDWSEPEFPSADDTGNLPPAPDFISLEWDDSGAGKGQPYRGLVTFDPVRNFDIPGGDSEDDVSRYAVKVQVKPKSSGSWSKHSIHTVEDKDDGEADEPITVAFRNANRKHRYRVFLRSVDRFNRRSAWAGPYPDNDGLRPGDDPNPPENVSATTPAPRRIQVTWDEPSVKPQEVDRYKVEIRQGSTLKETMYTRAQHIRYAVPEADKGKNHSATVYSVDEDGNVSAGVTDSANEAGDFGAGSGRIVVPFSVSGTVRAKLYPVSWTAPENMRIVRVRMRVGAHIPHDDDDPNSHPDDGCPRGGPIYANIRVADPDEEDTSPRRVFDADSRLKVPAGKHKDVAALDDIDSPNVDEDETLSIKLARDVTNTYMGRGLNISIVLEPR